MVHLVLDSSIYRADQKRSKNGFRAIARLAKAHKLALHVPYFVKHEVVTQQQIAVEAAIQEIRKAADTILRTTTQPEIVAYATVTDSQAMLSLKTIHAAISSDFDQWLNDLDAEQYPVTEQDALAVVEDYFSGNPPFRKQKFREDIPDSFIWRSILRIAEENGIVHVVTADNGLFETVARTAGIIAHLKLDDFVQSPECQAEIKASWSEIYEENIERAHSLLGSKSASFSEKIKELLRDALLAETITDDQIPSDDHEATINHVQQPIRIKLLLDEVSYFGETEIGIMFDLDVDCTLEYRLYQGEYYRIPGEQRRHLRVADSNEHYFNIEEDYPTEVKGVLTLRISDGRLGDINLTDPDLERLIENASCSISISTIEIE